MNKTRHRIVAAIVLCVPLLSMAQGYKCKQSDGSVSYQDHACAAGTASSSAVPLDLGGSEQVRRGLPSTAGLDSSCQQPAKHAMSVCMGAMDTQLKQCQSATMTPTCRAQMDGPRDGKHDDVCVKQALGCLGQSMQGVKACFQSELPPACMHAADRGGEAPTASLRRRGVPWLLPRCGRARAGA